MTTISSRSVLFFTLINILNYMDRYLVNAVLPLLVAEYSLSHEQGGRIVSSFVIGYVLFSPLFGWLGDRYSRPLLMTIGVVCWSLATVGTSLADAFFHFVLARIFIGVGEASFGTIAPGYLKDSISDPIRLNRSLSVFFTAIPVGAALGFVLGGLLAQKIGWHYVFLLGGVPGLILAPFLLRYREVRVAAPPPPASIVAQFREVWRVPMIRYAILGYVLNSFSLTGIAAFVASYGVSIGFRLDQINLAFGIILVVTGLVGTLLGGRVSSALARGSKRPTLVMLKFIGCVSLAAAPLIMVAFWTTDRTIFLVACALAELLVFAAMAPVNTIIVMECPPALVTFSQGLTIFMINFFGALSGPLLIGLVADHWTLGMGLQLTTVAMLGSGIIWLYGSQALRGDASR